MALSDPTPYQIALILQAEGLGTYGTDIFIAKEQDSPNNCITVYDTGGIPDDVLDPDSQNAERPAFQVRVRNASYLAGYAVMVSVLGILNKKRNVLTDSEGGTAIVCALESLPFDLPQDTKARSIRVANFSCFRNVVSVTPPSDLLLDLYPATAAYSVARLLRTAYTGDAIRVRRQSDNAEQDIGFVSGELDTASLATFCSGTDGFVATIYDQQGSADATQATASNQLKIYDSATGVLLENGKPAARNAASSTTGLTSSSLAATAAQPNTVFAVAAANSTNLMALFDGITSEREALIIFGNKWQLGAGASLNGGPADTLQHVFGALYNGVSSKLWVDGAVNASGNTGASAITGLTIGRQQTGGLAWQGAIQEVILYNADKTSDRVAIETNINDFYEAH